MEVQVRTNVGSSTDVSPKVSETITGGSAEKGFMYNVLPYNTHGLHRHLQPYV